MTRKSHYQIAVEMAQTKNLTFYPGRDVFVSVKCLEKTMGVTMKVLSEPEEGRFYTQALTVRQLHPEIAKHLEALPRSSRPRNYVGSDIIEGQKYILHNGRIEPMSDSEHVQYTKSITPPGPTAGLRI